MISLTRKSVDELIPYVRNAKIHPESQVSEIAASIAEFGFLQPILIYSNNEIIAGHGRLLAAKKLGMSEVDCILADHLNEQQVKAYRLIDNRIAQNSNWDKELLSLEVEEIGGEFNFETFGFQLDELNFSQIDYSSLDNEQDPDFEAMRSGVRKAIQIDFELDDYDEAYDLYKTLRGKGLYIGGLVLAILRDQQI